jgi:single-stranded DNA-specific DHH superfamily exonuclease
MASDAQTAAELAAELCELNRRRQSIETDIWADANGMLSGSAGRAHRAGQRKLASGRHRHRRLPAAEQYSCPQ